MMGFDSASTRSLSSLLSFQYSAVGTAGGEEVCTVAARSKVGALPLRRMASFEIRRWPWAPSREPLASGAVQSMSMILQSHYEALISRFAAHGFEGSTFNLEGRFCLYNVQLRSWRVIFQPWSYPFRFRTWSPSGASWSYKGKFLTQDVVYISWRVPLFLGCGSS